MPDVQPGQRVRILADATVVEAGADTVLALVDGGEHYVDLTGLRNLGDFDVRALGPGRDSRPVFDWAVRLVPGADPVLMPGDQFSARDSAVAISRLAPGSEVVRRRVDRGPWTEAPGG